MDHTNLIDYLREADKYNKDELNRVEQLLTWEVGPQVVKVMRQEMLIKPQ